MTDLCIGPSVAIGVQNTGSHSLVNIWRHLLQPYSRLQMVYCTCKSGGGGKLGFMVRVSVMVWVSCRSSVSAIIGGRQADGLINHTLYVWFVSRYFDLNGFQATACVDNSPVRSVV